MKQFKEFALKAFNILGKDWKTTNRRMAAGNVTSVILANEKENKQIEIYEVGDKLELKIIDNGKIINKQKFDNIDQARNTILNYVNNKEKIVRNKILSIKEQVENNRIQKETEFLNSATEEYLRILNQIINNGFLDNQKIYNISKIRKIIIELL